MPIAWEIDPTSENASNVPLVISSGSYRILEMEIPPANINPMFASSADTEGDRYVDSRYVNRTITLTVLVKATTDALTQTATNDLQQKAEKLRRDGGTLKFTTQAGSTLVADVNFVQITPELTSELYALNQAVKFTLAFDCAPFFRGAPVLLSDHAETTNPALVFTETGIGGDVPALGSLVIDNDQAAPSDQLSTIVGWRSKYYSSAATAALYIAVNTRTLLNGATIVGSSVQKTNVWNAWIAAMSTQASGGGAQLTHIGTYRVFTRANITGAQTAQIGLEWGTGDLTKLTRNDPVTLLESTTVLADLGLIYIPPGTSSWQGRIIVRSTSSTSLVAATVNFHGLIFVPVDEGSGVATANALPAPASAPSVFDNFVNPALGTTGTSLNGRTGTSGGTWATGGSTVNVPGGGEFGQFPSTTPPEVGRFQNGPETVARWATYGTSITGAVDVNANVKILDLPYTEAGIIARAGADPNADHIRFAIYQHYVTRGFEFAHLVVRASGVDVTAKTVVIPESIEYRNLRLVVDTFGNAVGIISTLDGLVQGVLRVANITQLATGGALANGKIGFWAFQGLDQTVTDGFQAIYASTSVSLDAAMYSGKSLTLTHNSVKRTERSTSDLSPVNWEGDYLRVPQAGKENRTVEFIIRGSRGYIGSSSPGDVFIDDISARLTVTPRYLVLPP